MEANTIDELRRDFIAAVEAIAAKQVALTSCGPGICAAGKEPCQSGGCIPGLIIIM